MANNDKLKQIISNLQILTDLANSMIDAEIYPVSFFSQSFDLIQKIQNDTHTLEADQVELFASQMKKHQALILSIHQQMRNISPEKSMQEQEENAPSENVAQAASEKPQKPVAGIATGATATEAPKQEEGKIKKISLLSRLGIYKEERQKEAEKPEASVIEEPIKAPAKKTIASAAAKPVTTAATAAALPTEKAKKAPVVKRASAPVTAPVPTPTSPTPAPTPAPVPAPLEPSAPHSLKEAIEKNKLSDLRKAFSLNDRFLYRRELFGGNEETMNKVLTALNGKKSYKESVAFLEEKLHWDFSDPTVKSFAKILELRFL